jgi:hypothetical protein
MGSETAEDGVAIAIVAIVQVGGRRKRSESARVPLVGGKDGNEPRWLVNRQRVQQDRVDERENRRVGTDAERERQDGRSSETRRPAHKSDAVSQILKHNSEHWWLRPWFRRYPMKHRLPA